MLDCYILAQDNNSVRTDHSIREVVETKRVRLLISIMATQQVNHRGVHETPNITGDIASNFQSVRNDDVENANAFLTTDRARLDEMHAELQNEH